MRSTISKSVRLLVVILCLLLFTSCTAGDVKFTHENPAGFLYGLWHGMLSVISLIVHLFNENIKVYEVNNSGGWYDFGFLLGTICVWGGGSVFSNKSYKRKKREKEWDEICEKVEKKVMRKLKTWSEDDDNEWGEISEKVEKKLKHKIREWAEKE